MAFYMPWSRGRAAVTSWRLQDNREVHVSPITQQEQIEHRPGSRHTCSINLDKMTDVNAQIWFAHLVRGLGEAFYLSPPKAEVSLAERLSGVAPGVPYVDGADQSGVIFQTAGWPPLYDIPAGMYFEVLAGGRLHLCLIDRDVQAGADGRAPIQFYPPVYSAPAGGALLRLNGPRGEFRIATDLVGWDWSRLAYADVRLEAAEWLR